MDKFSRIVLKGIIKGLTSQGEKSRRLMQMTSGATRAGHRFMKKRIGAETRAHLLAYAFLRGTSYREMEPRTDWSNKYWLEQYAAALTAVVNRFTWYEPGKNKKNQMVDGRYRRVYTKEEITAWLQAEPRREKQPLRPRVPYSPPVTASAGPGNLLSKFKERLMKAATA